MAHPRDGPRAERGSPSIDPFGLPADPENYIPRSATEAALGGLLRAVRDPVPCAALIGPAGLGKTLLLHLLRDRIGDGMEVIYLPSASLSSTELSARVLSLIGSPATEDPRSSLKILVRHRLDEHRVLLMLIDDAGAMPLPTARWLGELLVSAPGGVRLVLAADDDSATALTLAALGSEATAIRLVEPMSESETRTYIEARLARNGVDAEMRARFDAITLQRLHRASGGFPGRLEPAAAAVLRHPAPAPAEPETPSPAANRVDLGPSEPPSGATEAGTRELPPLASTASEP